MNPFANYDHSKSSVVRATGDKLNQIFGATRGTLRWIRSDNGPPLIDSEELETLNKKMDDTQACFSNFRIED